MNPPAPIARPCAVIDTQSVLDWHYFDNPACGHWLESLAAGHWHWIATTAMRDELAHVLGRGIPGRPGPSASQVLAAFDRWTEVRPAPTPSLGGWPRCRDPDDQKFVDLALLGGAAWLVSRDKAVLKLARRCLAQTGLVITPPHLWAPLATV